LRGLSLGRSLADLGIGLLLGPSLHLARPGSRGALHSFGPTPELVVRAFGAFAEGLHGAGVLVAAGSFPGADPDTEVPPPSASAGPHLEPFAGALSRGLEAVSVSGRPLAGGAEAGTGGDREWPACCSAAVVRDGLRDGLGFGGLAIAELAEPDHAPKALAAGCDLLAVRRAEQVMPALEALEREVAGSSELAAEAVRAAGRVLAARTAWLG
ncbi:MAG: hypothetical protein MI919_24110, partial [Holophagales bacterium]|nr:hypothetical protein [Holophagales bacterium]